MMSNFAYNEFEFFHLMIIVHNVDNIIKLVHNTRLNVVLTLLFSPHAIFSIVDTVTDFSPPPPLDYIHLDSASPLLAFIALLYVSMCYAYMFSLLI